MQYLLKDLIKLPLNERLTIIERAINSIAISDDEVHKDLISLASLSNKIEIPGIEIER